MTKTLAATIADGSEVRGAPSITVIYVNPTNPKGAASGLGLRPAWLSTRVC